MTIATVRMVFYPLRTAISLKRILSLLLCNCMRIVCSSSHWKVRCLCPHLPRAAFDVGSRCLLSIVPLLLPILSSRSAWLLCWVLCGHCGASRWRMAVQSLAPCTLPVSFISRTHRYLHRYLHRRALVGPCCRVQLPAHGQPEHGEECCRCAWRGVVGGGALDECRDGCEGAPILRRH
ncbi:surface protease GP63 [Trypanosoma cruzi]|nr:surface protease GP63 [Trypanosoma cruzi]